MIVKELLIDFLNKFIVKYCDCTSDINLDGDLDFVYSFLESEVDVVDVVDNYIKKNDLESVGVKSDEDVIRDFILFYNNQNRNSYEGEVRRLTETELAWIRLYGESNE